jgi:hypothetical protein
MPEQVKAIYYSAYGASRNDRIKSLINLAQEGKINAVVIDIKEINGGIYFKIPENDFKIKPDWEIILRNPKKLIEILHQNNIYVIGRIVVFKDKNLVKKRPDLAVKKSDQKTV